MGFSNQERINLVSKAVTAGILDSNEAAQWYESALANYGVVPGRRVWLELTNIENNPAATLAQAQSNATGPLSGIIDDLSAAVDAVQLTAYPGMNYRTYVAYTTVDDLDSTVLDNWVAPHYSPLSNGRPSIGYSIRLYAGDPNAGGVEIKTTDGTTGTGVNKTVGWVWNYSNGILLLSEDFFSITGIDPTATDLYVTGFRYIGTTAGGGGSQTLQEVLALGNTTGGNDIVVSAGDAITSATGPLVLDADTTITGNLNVQGTVTAIDSETVLVEDNHLYLNSCYELNAPQTGGLVVNYDPTTTTDTVGVGGFTAGVATVSNPSVETVGTGTFSAGDLIQICGSNSLENTGLFEVLSHVGTTLIIRGIGTTATVEDFTQNQFVDDSVVAGTITHINVSVLRAGIDGIWETGLGNSTPISFTNIGASVTLQSAYVAGNTITTNATDGDVVVAGTEALHVTATGGLEVDNISEATLNNGVVVNGIRHYGSSATNPAAPAPSDGDRYYNTAIRMEMQYDGSRSKWLSVATAEFFFGRNGITALGQYYRGIDGRVHSASLGYYAIRSGTIVGFGYTRSDSDNADFELMASGAVIHTINSGAVGGRDITANADFTFGNVLAVRNKLTGNPTSDVQGWLQVKWRV